MRRPVQFVVECIGAVVVAAPLMAVGILVGHMWRDPLPRSALWATVYGTLAVCFLVATLRPGGSLRRP